MNTRALVLAALFWLMLPAAAWADPLHITIPTIGTDADVVASVDAPDDPDQVAWYSLGPDVGTVGNAVFSGHIDWAGRLRTFGLLHQLQPGDSVEVIDAEGNTLDYSVQWLRLYEADTAPLDTIYGQSSAEQTITLISCGGIFNQTTHSYESRWVARAIRLPQD